MSIKYLDLVDYIAMAAEVTGLEVETIVGLPNLPLADSALQAPQAGFGDEEFYPELLTRQQFWSPASPATIHCPTETNERLGSR